MIIPTFIINLKKDSDKKEHMQRLCDEIGLTPTFIDAVYGKELSQKDLDAVYDEEVARQSTGRPLARSEIGCSLSHLSVYQQMVDNNIPYALIFEDDIEIKPDFVTLVTRLVETVLKDDHSDNKDVILLGYYQGRQGARVVALPGCSFYGRTPLGSSYKLQIPVEPAAGTHGYVITLGGAQKILDHNKIISFPIDYYTGRNTGCISVALVYPPVVVLHDELSSDEQSNISHDRNLMEEVIRNKKGLKQWLKRWLLKVPLVFSLCRFPLSLTRQIRLFYKQIKR